VFNQRCSTTSPTTLAGVAIGSETGKIFITGRIDQSRLQAGTNLLAVEFHQNAASSSDLSFDLALSCYLPGSAVRSSVISGFYGFNSDALDIGEQARNILVDSLVVLNVFDKGVTAVIPPGILIGPKSKVFITSDPGHSFWDNVSVPVIGWSGGKLSGNGESLRLVDPYSIVQDYFVCSDKTWPLDGF
jgi:hypothetical protein